MAGWVMAAKIGPRVRDARIALQMTQAELGELVGVNDQQVSNWERGTQRPPEAKLELIAIKTGLPIEVFAEGGPMAHTLVNRPVNGSPPSDLGDVQSAVRVLSKVVQELQREMQFLEMDRSDLRADLDELRTEVEFHRSRQENGR